MAEPKEWTRDEAAAERIRAELTVIDMVHEGKPTCRLCGQTTNRLDTFGLCSKTTDAHKERRGQTVPLKKARKR